MEINGDNGATYVKYKQDSSASSAVKVRGRKGQDGEVGHGVKEEYRDPEGQN